MKPFVEKLHLDESTSFYAALHATPNFEVTWHQHPELELISFEQGHGTAYVGNAVTSFHQGDIFLLGSNLPHTFQKAKKDMQVKAVVVQFLEEFLGQSFIAIPEASAIKDLYSLALNGLKIESQIAGELKDQLLALTRISGMEKVIALLRILSRLSEAGLSETLSSRNPESFVMKHNERIDSIYRYTIANFHQDIALSEMADMAAMTIPAFCNYFKKITRKTYVQFLNEVRISHACKQLSETDESIMNICYSCGYNTPANFNKQFMKQKNMSPLQFRKSIRHVTSD